MDCKPTFEFGDIAITTEGYRITVEVTRPGTPVTANFTVAMHRSGKQLRATRWDKEPEAIKNEARRAVVAFLPDPSLRHDTGTGIAQLGHGIIGTAGYVGSNGTDLLTTDYVNAINPATGARPYPSLGIVEYRGNTSNSDFNALNLSAQRYFHRSLSLGSNYMWSHSINDGSIGGGEVVFPQFLSCRVCERASSDQDVRQEFTATRFICCPSAGAGANWMILALAACCSAAGGSRVLHRRARVCRSMSRWTAAQATRSTATAPISGPT